ncbi:YndJ family protein [Filobacillus milosensis]|uniref:YndJ family protein n=1 Tax=Filobacillus milosensis TaxID=94137 RepID=UPI001891787A|nr:YndJ family protein [Filobacillus milosensis]
MKTLHRIALLNLIVLGAIAWLSPHEWYFLLLTVAQLVYVPFLLGSFLKKDELAKLSSAAFLAVIILQLTGDTRFDGLLAAIYFFFTIVIAFHGVKRFLNRGFTHLEEFMIDIGMVYLAVGGMWFFAYEAGINTGFSPMLKWLTAIHFHYSAFMLPIIVGLLGRIDQLRGYRVLATIIIVSPIIVALGITFSTTLELVSVLVYIVAIYGLILLSFRTKYTSAWQKWFMRLAFLALGMTILFSLAYAYGNWSGSYHISITFMLKFHGLMNAVIFGVSGVMVATAFLPPTKFQKPNFPVSKLRGKARVGEGFLKGKVDYKQSVQGLVDDMTIYQLDFARTIKDFYENTGNYRLFAEVNWRHWFLPFAMVYRLFSRVSQQINLPISKQQVEMTGDIYSLKKDLDSRDRVRAWVRKINHDTTFVALYSEHQESDKTYMNIALPLPGATMTGILALSKEDESLILSSREQGIYLGFRDYLMKLPLHEKFKVREIADGRLIAEHRMWLFNLPFLTIDYEIVKDDIYEK